MPVMPDCAVLPGCPHPLGARAHDGGVGFSVYSADAQRIELLLFDHVDDARPASVIDLSAPAHRTWHYWHAFVPGLGVGQLYAWRAHGVFDPVRGLRFDGDKVLLDPYGRAVAVPRDWRRGAACVPGRNDAFAAKSVVADPHGYDWEGDTPLRRPFDQAVIYELHVRGFTRHPSSGVDAARRGSYAGLVEKIPYLLDLGVTAVELMPVFQFDPQDAPPGRVNHWGYAPVSFFAPHGGYASASASSPLAVLDEFRDMVKALHRAGIEVLLDVVFNHTAEGDGLGPTLGLRGLDNATYYLLEPGGRYANYAGCGNTLNANHPVVRRLILDSLHYWVHVMHVDGFRFDLAAILARDERGTPQANAPVLWDIESDPLLAGTRLIAEAWDAAGLDRVGSFSGERWKEWNGRFRDDARAFVRGDPGVAPRLAERLRGSPDLYRGAAGHNDHPDQLPRSVNFVTSHDGFTLQDLVSYDRKHNETNREANRDGSDHNLSWNCGVEGPSDDPAVRALRERQTRNLLTITLLALGTPMLLMGDEIGRTQHGNNNAYCHDDETGWLDWTLLGRHAGLHRFVRGLIALRRLRHAVGAAPLPATDPAPTLRPQGLALTLVGPPGRLWLHLAVNASPQPLELTSPPRPPGVARWRRLVDTARPSPQDLFVVEPMPPGEKSSADPLAGAEAVAGPGLRVEPRSVVVLGAWVGDVSADSAVSPFSAGAPASGP